MRNTNSNKTTEKDVLIDQLNNQLNDVQQMHMDLLEKQANKEEQYIEDKKAQEKIMQEKIHEYEMKMALMKSKFLLIKFISINLLTVLGEFMVEMENARLDHDQVLLRLKTQFQQAASGSKQFLSIFLSG